MANGQQLRGGRTDEIGGPENPPQNTSIQDCEVCDISLWPHGEDQSASTIFQYSIPHIQSLISQNVLDTSTKSRRQKFGNSDPKVHSEIQYYLMTA